jgi:exodeoxyribonuclease VII small subunit
MGQEKDINYSDAMRRIKTILSKIETDSADVDVDGLIGEVEEAASLILACKKKLHNTETKIEKVLDTLEHDAPAN